MSNQEYFIGLDMGTSSVGWAVTDTQYHLLRAKGRDMWGIREFDEAQTSAERRSFRVARRRKQRKQVRIGLLRHYFQNAIFARDPEFYIRMDNSFYRQDDKKTSGRNALFNDDGFTDKDYYKKYPTIFHLIMDIIHKKAPQDPRLVYLAIVNIFKHRGHFLNESLSEVENVDISESWETLREELCQKAEIELPKLDKNTLEDIFCTANKISDKEKELKKYINNETKAKAVIKALCGGNANVVDMFDLEVEKDEKDEYKIQFSSANYEEKALSLADSLDGEFFDCLSSMKEFFDLCAWKIIIGGADYLSEARIQNYVKHQDDLRKLKKLIRENKNTLPENTYNDLFRSDKSNSYTNYIGSNNSYYDNKKARRLKKNKEDFYKNIKNLLAKIDDGEDKTYILEEIEKGNFLPKQLTNLNGVIPHQAHLKELKAVLNSAKEYLAFLNETTDDCPRLTVAEQIIEIFKFRVPYYIGPMSENSEKNGGNGWVIRKDSGRVFPWNMEDKIDDSKTAEKFIENLIGKCSYIADEKVMPKSSLLYEKFTLLNEINAIAINSRRIDAKLKQEIYQELFMSGRSISKNGIKKYLQGVSKWF